MIERIHAKLLNHRQGDGLMFPRFLQWSAILLSLGVAVAALSSCSSKPLEQPVNVEPLASAVFPADVNLDILGSGKVVAFRKDYLLSYSDAAVIYSDYAFDKFPSAEGLITIVVTRGDTREEADGLYDKQCSSWDYPETTSQFDGGRACVSVVKATVYNDVGDPEWYQAYLVAQKDALVIDLRQRGSTFPLPPSERKLSSSWQTTCSIWRNSWIGPQIVPSALRSFLQPQTMSGQAPRTAPSTCSCLEVRFRWEPVKWIWVIFGSCVQR